MAAALVVAPSEATAAFVLLPLSAIDECRAEAPLFSRYAVAPINVACCKMLNFEMREFLEIINSTYKQKKICEQHKNRRHPSASAVAAADDDKNRRRPHRLGAASARRSMRTIDSRRFEMWCGDEKKRKTTFTLFFF